MRPRTKTTACYSAAPDGKKHVARKEVLRRKYECGDISTEELREYSSFIMHSRMKDPIAVITKIMGTTTRVSYREFVERYQPYGFVIIEKIY